MLASLGRKDAVDLHQLFVTLEWQSRFSAVHGLLQLESGVRVGVGTPSRLRSALLLAIAEIQVRSGTVGGGGGIFTTAVARLHVKYPFNHDRLKAGCRHAPLSDCQLYLATVRLDRLAQTPQSPCTIDVRHGAHLFDITNSQSKCHPHN